MNFHLPNSVVHCWPLDALCGQQCHIVHRAARQACWRNYAIAWLDHKPLYIGLLLLYISLGLIIT